jgi:hypothetical protein
VTHIISFLLDNLDDKALLETEEEADDEEKWEEEEDN